MELEDLYNDEPLEPKKTPEQKPGGPDDRVKVSVQEALATLCSRVVLGAILFIAFIAGCWVAGTALHDPDTCWLLGLGRWIFEHKAIPDIDPFSWTFAVEEAKGRQFILYQWLSELIFYLSTLSGGLLTLLMLNAVVIVTAFLSLPVGYIVRRGAPFLPALVVVVIGMMAASFHSLSRPEIFSYLFIAIFLQLAHHARATLFWKDESVFRIAFVMIPLMVLWANMHTGFITGLAIIAGCLLGAGIGKLVSGARTAKLLLEISLALVGSVLATLITPYGLRLWAYIPDLFGSPINKYIIELKPVTFATLGNATYWPYVILCVILFALLIREGLAWRKESLVLGSDALNYKSAMEAKSAGEIAEIDAKIKALVLAEIITAVVVGSIAVYLGFTARRLMSFTTLIIVGEIVALLGLRRLARHAHLQIIGADSSSAPVGASPDQDDKARAVQAEIAAGIAEAVALAEKNGTQKTGTQKTEIQKDGTPENGTRDTGAQAAGKEAPQTVSAQANSADGNTLLSTEGEVSRSKPVRTFWQDVNMHSLDVWLTGGAFELAIVSFCAIAGVCLVATRVAKPELPSSSIAFKAPFKAIEYIEKHKAELKGNLFNDPQFGDMIIWQLRADPKVFVDTRFDMYGARIVDDSRNIVETLGDWKPVFDNYKIDWIFVNPKAPLALRLANDAAWETRFSDDAAVIMVRKSQPKSAL